MQNTKFSKKFYRYCYLEGGANSGLGGKWKVQHEKERDGTWRAAWKNSKNTDRSKSMARKNWKQKNLPIPHDAVTVRETGRACR